MSNMYIRLNTIQDVRNFVNVVTSADNDIDLTSGRYVVDAKSIMGIFSLDLMNPILLTIQGDADPKLLEALQPFVVDAPEK